MSNNIVPLGENKSQRPANSAFKQQKLSAWQPILTAGTVLPTFFLIGVAFIPIGIGLLISSYQVQEFEVDYTSCVRVDANLDSSQQGTTCAEYIELNPSSNCTCAINITLPNDFKRDVFIYYGLTNFYQNHRRYVKSRDDNQLLGKDPSKRPNSNCYPFDVNTDLAVMPCGAIANSLFNDTFQLQRLTNNTNGSPGYRDVPFTQIGIAWATDKKNKFRNPQLEEGQTLEQAFNGTVQPANWAKPIYNLDSHKDNNGLQNEGLIVWMRTAAFPTFRKVYARISHDKRDLDVDYQFGLPSGQYRIIIDYVYPVAAFKGKKRFIISNTSWLGGKNPFIGAVYIFVGLCALILSAVFLLIHKKFNKNSDNLNITSQTPFVMSS